MGTPREVQGHPGVIEAYLGSVDEVELRRASMTDPDGIAAPIPPAVSDHDRSSS